MGGRRVYEQNLHTVLSLTLYSVSVVGANLATANLGLVPIGFGLAVTAGTFCAGAALILRDWVQVAVGRGAALVAILIGAGLSYWLAGPALAIASGLAFLVSEVVDLVVFTRLQARSLTRAVVLSSVASAPVDTVLFLWLAGFPLTWQAVAGQFIVKTALALAAAAWIAYRRRK